MAREGAMRLGGTMRLREDPPANPATRKQGKVKWSVEPAQITDLVTPFACADYPAGGAPSIKSLRSDGVVPTPTVLKANEWLRAGAAELESGAPKVAHPGGNTSSNAAALAPCCSSACHISFVACLCFAYLALHSAS